MLFGAFNLMLCRNPLLFPFFSLFFRAFVNAVLARGALLRKQAGIADSSAMKL